MFDVAIIGGGPAGSSSGTLLAKAGRKVVILEKERFPRFRVGESMLPACSDTLERMGVKEKIDRGGFLVKYGGEIVPACSGEGVRFYFKNGRKAKRDTSYQVLRSRFDQILLEHAAESGCDVRQEVSVADVEFDPDGAELRLSDDSTIRSRYVIDCSGRNCLLGKKFQLRKAFPNLQKFSVFAYYDNVGRLPGPDGTLTKMIRAKDRWFWMIPLSGGETSIGVVMDTARFKALGMPPEQALQHCLQEQPTILRWMTNAQRTTPVYATGDFSYRNTRFTGDRWMLAGDAAGFIDPVFSSGVFLALLSGELAADALNKILANPSAQPVAFRYYEKRVGRVLDLYLRWASAWYTQEFVEVFLFPKEMFELVPTISAVLSGNEAREFDMRWRLWIFDTLVKLQKRTSKIAPSLALTPQQSHAEPSR